MFSGRQVVSSAALFAVTATICAAQVVAPSHSGTVHYFEGDVTIDGTKLVSQAARFDDLKEGATLHAGLGRAEILLTPGVILRVGENSSVKMLDNRLMSTRVELLSGTAMVEDMDEGTVKDPPVTIIYKDFSTQSMKAGIFELTSDPAQLRVFKGEAKLTGNGATLTVKDGNLANMNTVMATAKFDAKSGDDLYLWSRDRSASLSAGNMSSARALAASGYSSGSTLGYGVGGWDPRMWAGFSGGWYYNPYLNMYSFMPFAGTLYSPFGYGYYNPVTIAYVYTPGYYWQGAGGARTGSTSGVQLPTLVNPTSTRTGSVAQLPRLGVTATTRPTLSPVRSIQPSINNMPSASNNTFGSAMPSSGGGGSSPAVNSTVRAAAPSVSAAPSAGASAAGARTSSAGRR
jgi:hypothetical protein